MPHLKLKPFLFCPVIIAGGNSDLFIKYFSKRIQHPVLKGKSLTNFSARLFRAFKKQIYQ